MMLLAGGCASGTNGFRQAITNVAITTAGGYRALDIYDADRQAECVKVAAYDPHLSRVMLAKHLEAYGKVQKVLDGAQDTVELAADAADAIDRGLKSPKSPGVWVVELLALIPKIVATLADLGLKVGPPVPINYGGGNPLPMPKAIPVTGASPAGGAK